MQHLCHMALTIVSPVMWKFWTGHDGLWGQRMIRWQEPHGGAACSPSSPSLHEKWREVMCYLKLCIKLRTIFDADIQEKIMQCQHSFIMLLKDRSLILKQFSSTLTRLLDPWSRVRDGLLWPVADSVGSSRIRTRREATRCRPPGGSSNPLISLISRPSLSIPILCCSTGTLIDEISHIKAFLLSKRCLKLSVLYWQLFRNEVWALSLKS